MAVAGGVFEGVANDGASLKAYSLPGVSLQEKGTATIGTSRWYVPITVQAPIKVVNMVAEVTGGTASGRALRVGLYESTFHLQPAARIAEGEIDASSTGIKTVAVDQVIQAGRYMLVFQSNHSNVTYRYIRYTEGNLVHLDTNWARLSSSDAYGELPDPGPQWDSFTTASTKPFSVVFLEVVAP